MSVRRFSSSGGAASVGGLLEAFTRLGLTSALLCAAASGASAQGPRPEIVRHFNVSGQVSLPDERPAARVRVRITGRGGVHRETLTNDGGRFEFNDLPAGSYTLSAQSMTDPSLAAGPAEADTSRTATGTLTVSLSLRAAPPAAGERPAVVSARELEQRVPAEARKAFKRGLKLKGEDRAEEALASFTRAVELYPDYFQALSERGDLRVARRELAEAARDFEQALRVDPRYAPALRGAGYCKLEAREFERAVEYLESAAAVEPLNVGTHLLNGVANLELGRREQARQSLRRALELDPKRAVRAHIHLANLYASEQLYAEAADELRRYIDAVVFDPELDEMRKVEARWRALAKVK